MSRSRAVRTVCVLGFCALGLGVQAAPADAASSVPAVRLCDHHRYFEVVTATRHGTRAVLTGHTTKHVCGRGGSSYHAVAKTSTITLRDSSVVRVFTKPGGGGPAHRTIKPAGFPTYFRRDNKTGPFPGEDNYRLYGARTHPTKIVEQFQE